jgi:SAM-dependent methyltransferase
MDTWLYFDVTHTLHTFCNPIAEPRIDEIGRLLELGPEDRVLDIACGMGELLVRWSEQHGIGGVGVDISSYAVERAWKRKAARVPEAPLEFITTGGKEYETDETFDVVSCIGASWIWDGHEGTLRAMKSLAKPGGLLVVGEPWWMADPSDDYLEADGLKREQFGTLAECRQTALDLDLEPVWMAGSTTEEWDRYEMLQTASVAQFAQKQPNHADLAEIREGRAKADEIYLKWGRKHVGFALWVWRLSTA